MNKDVKNISIHLYGEKLKSLDRARIGYIVVDLEDTRMAGSVELEMFDDKEIQKLIESLWNKCCDYIKKSESF